MGNFTIVNLNAARISSVSKVKHLSNVVEDYSPTIVCIQKINIKAAYVEFSCRYKVFVNLEANSRDGVGIVTLVRLGIDIQDIIIGINGRIIGVKCENLLVRGVSFPL